MPTRQRKQTVPVSLRALEQRINRKLQSVDEWRRLKRTRGQRWRSSLGDHYIIDLNRNFILQHHVDVVALGRELGALEPYEHLEVEAE